MEKWLYIDKGILSTHGDLFDLFDNDLQLIVNSKYLNVIYEE